MGFVKRKNKTPLFQFSAPPPHSSPRVLQVILELLPPAPFYYLSLLFNSTLLVSPVTRVHASMDNTMEIDTARSPEPHHLSPITDPGSIPTLDGWIESLMTCKQLAEDDVRRLCDRVGFLFFFFFLFFFLSFLDWRRWCMWTSVLINCGFCPAAGKRGVAGRVERPAGGMFLSLLPLWSGFAWGNG